MSIFTHVCVGAMDIQESAEFYDRLLATVGVDNLGPLGDRGFFYGRGNPEFVVMTPSNGDPASPANGGTVSFAAATRSQVRTFHAVGVAMGAQDEGAPGPRPFPPNAYSCYLRDPVGNKVSAYCFAEGE